jgi:hypothetical protein
MICDGRGCSVIAHLNCYFSAGSQDADDTISDIEHWHCEKCGGLPRHMHPRPRAAKRARVSFDPVLPTPMATTSAQAVPTTHPSGGWGGHWPIRTAMPTSAQGKGKEAMEDPVNPKPIQDVIQLDDTIDPPRRPHDMRTKNSPSNRNPFGKPRPPRPKKKPPVRDKISHHHRSDAAGQGTRPSAQSQR